MPVLSCSCGPSVATTTLTVVVEFKEDLNAPRLLLVLGHSIKNLVGPVQSGSCVPSVATPTLMVVVECKVDLNASRALLVLEHNIK